MKNIDWPTLALFVVCGLGAAWTGANIGPKIVENIHKIQDPEEKGLVLVATAIFFNGLMYVIRPK